MRTPSSALGRSCGPRRYGAHGSVPGTGTPSRPLSVVCIFTPGGARCNNPTDVWRNTIYQIEKLMAQPEADVYGQTFLLADYPTVSIREWARLIRDKRGARRIRSIPIPALRAAGVLGAIVERMGLGYAPLTSCWVSNTTTDVAYDASPLEAIVGRLPFSLEEDADRTITSIKAAVV